MIGSVVNVDRLFRFEIEAIQLTQVSGSSPSGSNTVKAEIRVRCEAGGVRQMGGTGRSG
jgi:hypothetical protein